MPGVIIIGDEILSGRRQDKHLSKAIELLGERGLALSWARYEGDDPQRITAAVREALASDDAGDVRWVTLGELDSGKLPLLDHVARLARIALAGA